MDIFSKIYILDLLKCWIPYKEQERNRFGHYAPSQRHDDKGFKHKMTKKHNSTDIAVPITIYNIAKYYCLL